MSPSASTAPARKPTPSASAADAARGTRLDELGAAFRRVFRTLSRLRGRESHLAGSDISNAQFELLIELYERGELPAGELAAAARLAPATVTGMLDHLAQCGHVERVRSSQDRRVVVCRLTQQGARRIEAKRRAWESRWEQALQGFSERELQTATRVLARLGDMFEEVPEGAGCEGRVEGRSEPSTEGRKPG